jgi:hypothetical protein
VLEEIVLMLRVPVFLFWVDWHVWERVTFMSIFGISRCLCRVRERGDLGELGVMRREFWIRKTVPGGSPSVSSFMSSSKKSVS